MTTDIHKPFCFSVHVGGKPMKKYEINQETYIEANLYSKTSYLINELDEEGYTQNYPVTPFEVHGNFRNVFGVPSFLKLCVDGQQVWMKPFPPSYREQYFKISGIKDNRNGTVKELLFSLPKMTLQKDKDKQWTEELGTITLECLEAVEDGFFNTRRKDFQPLEEPKYLSDQTIHRQATKQDCSRKGGIAVSTRQGRNIMNFKQTNEYITMKRYIVGRRNFGKLTLLYRPRHILQELGIDDQAWKSAESYEIVPNIKQEIPSKSRSVEDKQNAQPNREKTIFPKSITNDLLNSDKENGQPMVEESTPPKSISNGKVGSVRMEKRILTENINTSQNSESNKSGQIDNEMDNIKNRLRSRTKSGKHSAEETVCGISKTIKKEALNEQENNAGKSKNTSKIIKQETFAEEEYNLHVKNVVSMLKDLHCNEKNIKKLFCISPSSVQIKKELLDGGDGGHLGKSLFQDKPSQYSQLNMLDPKQIKKEIIDEEEKEMRYIEIDDDIVMLEEIDNDVVWMGDDSCCFIDVEPEEVPVIDLVS